MSQKSKLKPRKFKQTKSPQHLEDLFQGLQEFRCPICFSLMAQPVQFACKHYFCNRCTQKLLKSRYDQQCPLCRHQISTTFKAKTDRSFKINIEYAMTKKVSEFKNTTTNTTTSTTNQVRFKFGNRYKRIRDGTREEIKQMQEKKQDVHSWTMFFETQDPTYDVSNYVAAVRYTLPRDFGKQRRLLTSAPFELKQYGWGRFDIPIVVYFQPWMKKKPLKLVHSLSFRGRGLSDVVGIDFNNE